MKPSAFLAAAFFVLLGSVPAPAQQMKLEIRDGRVTLDAQNVPVRQILAEWARIGGARIVNGDKVVGAPVTLQLTGVPERQALDIILRSVSGYMLAARQAGSVGASAFDRILILPTSSAPRSGQAASGPAPAASGFPQPGMPRPMPGMQPGFQPGAAPADVEEANDEAEEEAEVDQDVPPNPQPGMRGQRRPNVFPGLVPGGQPLPQPFQPQPFVQQPPIHQQPGEGVEGGVPNSQPGQIAPTPGNPFGLPAGSSSVPGIVVPVPQTPPRPPR
jgi:hypothetical protein